MPSLRASSTMSTPPMNRWSSRTSAVSGSTAPSSMVVRISGFFVRSEAGKLMAVSFLGVLQRRVAAAQVSHGLAPMVTRLCFKRLKSAAFRVIIGREWRRAAEVPAPVVYSRRQIMSSEMLYFGKLRTKGRRDGEDRTFR